MRPLKLLKWFCKPEYLIDVEGDLLEMYEKRVKQSGRRRANLLLWRDVILLFRPGMIRSLVPTYDSWFFVKLGVAISQSYTENYFVTSSSPHLLLRFFFKPNSSSIIAASNSNALT